MEARRGRKLVVVISERKVRFLMEIQSRFIRSTGQCNDHFGVLGGDGGWNIYDPVDRNHFYASYYNMFIQRWRNGRSRNVSPPVQQDEADSTWMVYVTMDPQDSDTVFTGS